MDVITAASVPISNNKVHEIALDAFGPVGYGLSALLMGRSSITLQGLFVERGVINADCLGQICATVWTLSPPVAIPKKSRIAH